MNIPQDLEWFAQEQIRERPEYIYAYWTDFESLPPEYEFVPDQPECVGIKLLRMLRPVV